MKDLFVSGVFPRISRGDNYCSARSARSARSAKCSYRQTKCPSTLCSVKFVIETALKLSTTSMTIYYNEHQAVNKY